MVLIKEYRIALPLSLDEYKVAQRYMVAKVSRESTGGGEGVEILKNEPYDDGETSGQFTHKLIHLGNRLPGWVKSLMPVTALQVEEKSWNAFPYCKTVCSTPFLGDRFCISVESRYIADDGKTENALKVSPEKLKQREVEYIDIAAEPIDPTKYKEEEDPAKFKSTKTGRGPLEKDWTQTTIPLLYCYKYCEVEFKYWGFQTKAEQMIHKLALRDVMGNSHRQVFCWIDQWFGMTMDDVTKMEADTQLELKKVWADKAAADKAAADKAAGIQTATNQQTVATPDGAGSS